MVEYDDVPKEDLRTVKIPEIDPNIFHSFNLRPRKKELIREVTPSPLNSSPSLSLSSSYQPSSSEVSSSNSSLGSSPSTSPKQSPTLRQRKCCCCLK